MGKFRASKLLARESWKLLMHDKEMLLFPIISSIVNVVAIVAIIAIFFFFVIGGDVDRLEQSGSLSNVIVIAYVFVTYFAATFITVFFQAGIIAIAHGRLNGNDLTFTDGLKIAFAKSDKIFIWSLISATVGTILRLISEKSDNLIAKIISGLLGAAWAILTFFIVPVIIIENISTKDSMKKSVETIKKTWGETVIINIGVGLYFMLLALLGVAIFIALLLTGKAFIIFPALALLMVYLTVLTVISSTLSTVFRVVLYEYATTGKVTEGFSSEIVQMAFQRK